MCPTGRGERAQAPDRNVARLKEAFDVLDRDGDGVIAMSDLETFLEDVAAKKLVAKDDVQSMLALVDGSVDFEQFLRILYLRSERDVTVVSWEEGDQDAYKAMFQILDRNGDGLICAEDLKAVMDDLGCHSAEEDMTAMFPGQRDGAEFVDGMMRYEDFVAMMSLQNRAKSNGLAFHPSPILVD